MKGCVFIFKKINTNIFDLFCAFFVFKPDRDLDVHFTQLTIIQAFNVGVVKLKKEIKGKKR